jgi:hypothetical protein
MCPHPRLHHLLALLLGAWTAIAAALPLETIKLPPGFAIELWARVDNARQMALGGVDTQGGVLYVGSMRRRQGACTALRCVLSRRHRDAHRRGPATCRAGWPGGTDRTVCRGSEPHPALRRYRSPASTSPPAAGRSSPILCRRIPIMAGSSSPSARTASSMSPSVRPATSAHPGDSLCRRYCACMPTAPGREVFARGMRNSVGFDWNPVDGVLWFTDNGRDMAGRR